MLRRSQRKKEVIVGKGFGKIEIEGLPSSRVFVRGENYEIKIIGDFEDANRSPFKVEFLDNAKGEDMAGVEITDKEPHNEFITFSIHVTKEAELTEDATLNVSFEDQLVVNIPVAVRKEGDKRPPAGLTLPRDVFQEGRAPQDLFDTLQKIVQWIFGFAVAISLIFLILAVFQFVTGGGDPQKTSEARQKLLYAVIGLAIGFVILGIPAVIRNIVV